MAQWPSSCARIATISGTEQLLPVSFFEQSLPVSFFASVVSLSAAAVSA